MTLTILGNQGPYPGKGGVCSGYLVEAAGRRILLDCGSGVLSALQQHLPLSGLDAIVLSHLHYDHFSDLLVFQYFMQLSVKSGLMAGPMPVWGPGTPQPHKSLLVASEYLDYTEITQQSRLDIGGVQLSFFRTAHPVESYAIRLEYGNKIIVYTGDSKLCPGLADFSRGAGILLADACFLHQEKQAGDLPHMSARECGILAREADAGRLLLTHFRPGSCLQDHCKEALEVFSHTEAPDPGTRHDV
ncbi:MAG TPA: MBL fold metallo-hydrolase [Clostridiales bacterium]|nr:MBL fold metallo-hydrolase [Clostridiales bacterium]